MSAKLLLETWWDPETLKDKEVNERVEPVLLFTHTSAFNTASKQGWETPTGSGTRM